MKNRCSIPRLFQTTVLTAQMNPLIAFSQDVEQSLNALIKRVINKKEYVKNHEGEYTQKELGICIIVLYS